MGMTKEELDALLSDDSLPNRPEKLPGTAGGSGSTQKIKRDGEFRRMREALASLMVSGYSRDRIVELMGKKEIADGKGGVHPGYGLTEANVDRLIRQVQSEWDEEDAERKRYAKAMAERRILREISEARTDKSHTALANLEKVLMMIQGTAEPLEVSVPTDGRISEALLRLLGEADPALVRELIERERAIEVESRPVPEPQLRSLPGGRGKKRGRGG